MIKTSNIAKGGIYTALSVLFIYLSSIMPTNKLALLAASSFLIPTAVITTGIKNSILIYISVSLLSFFIVSIKGIVLLYVLFFGIYGIVKYYIEKTNNRPIEILLKMLFFNISMGIIFLSYKLFFANSIDLSNFKFSVYVIIPFIEILFLIYDYSMNLFINYFHNKFKNNF